MQEMQENFIYFFIRKKEYIYYSIWTSVQKVLKNPTESLKFHKVFLHFFVELYVARAESAGKLFSSFPAVNTFYVICQPKLSKWHG